MPCSAPSLTYQNDYSYCNGLGSDQRLMCIADKHSVTESNYNDAAKAFFNCNLPSPKNFSRNSIDDEINNFINQYGDEGVFVFEINPSNTSDNSEISYNLVVPSQIPDPASGCINVLFSLDMFRGLMLYSKTYADDCEVGICKCNIDLTVVTPNEPEQNYPNKISLLIALQNTATGRNNYYEFGDLLP